MDSIMQQIGEALSPIFGTFEPVLVGRLFLVLILCGAIGFERSGHERASGFRPHILVGLGACLMTMAGVYAFPITEYHDPMRVASYVVSGIGFLGAGAILRHGTMVRGLTTAATIWGASGIGIACGVGLGWLAVIVTLLVLFTLMILDDLEDRWRGNNTTNELRIHLQDVNKGVGKALTALERLGLSIRSANLALGAGQTGILRVELTRPMSADYLTHVVNQLLGVKTIQRIDTSSVQMELIQQTSSSESSEQPKSLDNDLLKDLNDNDERNGKYPVD